MNQNPLLSAFFLPYIRKQAQKVLTTLLAVLRFLAAFVHSEFYVLLMAFVHFEFYVLQVAVE